MAKRGSGDGRERDRGAGTGGQAPGGARATGDVKSGKLKREQARAARAAERDARRAERESRKIERAFEKMERRLVEAQAIIADVAQRAETLDERLRSLRGEAAAAEAGTPAPAAEPAGTSDAAPGTFS